MLGTRTSRTRRSSRGGSPCIVNRTLGAGRMGSGTGTGTCIRERKFGILEPSGYRSGLS